MGLIGLPRTEPGVGRPGTGPGFPPEPRPPVPVGPSPKVPSTSEHAPSDHGPKIPGEPSPKPPTDGKGGELDGPNQGTGSPDNVQLPKEGGPPPGDPNRPGDAVPLPERKDTQIPRESPDAPESDSPTDQSPSESPSTQEAPSESSPDGTSPEGESGEGSEPGTEGDSENNPQDSCENCVEEPGFLEGMIPLWGSGKSAIAAFQRGQYIWGVVHTAMAISDLFIISALARSVVKAAGKTGAAAVAAVGRETGEQVAKETGEQVAKETGQQAAKETGEQTARETGEQATKKTAGEAANGLGAARAEKVAEITGGKVSGKEVITKTGRTDIDVIGKNGEYIQVGGPAKAKNLEKTATQLRKTLEAAKKDGVAAQAYFQKGTPQSVIDRAEKILGKDNVFTFSL